MLDRLLAQFADATDGSSLQDKFQAQVALARAQTEETRSLNIDSWLNEFLAGINKNRQEKQKIETGKQILTRNSTEKAAWDSEDKIDYRNQLKDVQAFDAILKNHPEISSKLQTQGVDIDAEKRQERAKLAEIHPDMSGNEIEAQCAITVYLRHQDIIYAAAPNESVRQELNASFDHLRKHARELGIPYLDSIRRTVGVLPSDKVAISAATNVAFDTRMTRVGNSLLFDSRSDNVQQLWTLHSGERPEKFVEISGGPRIRVAVAPELDNALALKKDRSLTQIAKITEWPEARTPEGYAVAKSLFPKHLETSKLAAESVPSVWDNFVKQYPAASSPVRQQLLNSMTQSCFLIEDAELRMKVQFGIEELTEAVSVFGEHPELLDEIGKKHKNLVAQESAIVTERISQQSDSFNNAVRTVDQIE